MGTNLRVDDQKFDLLYLPVFENFSLCASTAGRTSLGSEKLNYEFVRFSYAKFWSLGMREFGVEISFGD